MFSLKELIEIRNAIQYRIEFEKFLFNNEKERLEKLLKKLNNSIDELQNM